MLLPVVLGLDDRVREVLPAATLRRWKAGKLRGHCGPGGRNEAVHGEEVGSLPLGSKPGQTLELELEHEHVAGFEVVDRAAVEGGVPPDTALELEAIDGAQIPGVMHSGRDPAGVLLLEVVEVGDAKMRIDRILRHHEGLGERCRVLLLLDLRLESGAGEVEPGGLCRPREDNARQRSDQESSGVGHRSVSHASGARAAGAVTGSTVVTYAAIPIAACIARR